MLERVRATQGGRTGWKLEGHAVADGNAIVAARILLFREISEVGIVEDIVDAGVEAADLLIPGVNLARIVVGKGIEMRKKRS